MKIVFFLSCIINNIWYLNYNDTIKKVESVCKQWSKRKPLLLIYSFYYERDFMMSLSDDKLADIIGALRTTSRY